MCGEMLSVGTDLEEAKEIIGLRGVARRVRLAEGGRETHSLAQGPVLNCRCEE